MIEREESFVRCELIVVTPEPASHASLHKARGHSPRSAVFVSDHNSREILAIDQIAIVQQEETECERRGIGRTEPVRIRDIFNDKTKTHTRKRRLIGSDGDIFIS